MMEKATYLSLVIALVVAMFSSCGEDRTHEYYDLTEENQWIYSKMQEVYLWRDKIKEPSRTTFFSTPSKFFSSIIYPIFANNQIRDTIPFYPVPIPHRAKRRSQNRSPQQIYPAGQAAASRIRRSADTRRNRIHFFHDIFISLQEI